MSNSSSNSVKRCANDADCVSTVDQHADSVLEEVDSLVECLLMSIVPDTILLRISISTVASKMRNI